MPSERTVSKDPPRRQPGTGGPPRARARKADLGRRAEAVGEELDRLAAAAEAPSDADRMLAEAWAGRQRLGAALRRQSEELAIERRRTRALQAEIRRLRNQELRRQVGGSAGVSAA